MARRAWRTRLAGLAVGAIGLVVATGADAQTEPAPRQVVPVMAAAVAPVAVGAHVRGVKTGVYDAARLVDDATRTCPSIRRLLVALDETDVTVMVEVRDGVSNGRAHLTMMGKAGGARRLRLTVDAGQRWREQAAFLAHKLRHAVEVAGAPEVQDVATFGRLYERIGRPLGGGRYETDAAVAAENRALREAYAAGGRRK
jgi:hypothetical protein